MRKSKCSQLFSFDIGVTLLIFVSFILLFINLWNNNVSDLDDMLREQDFQERVLFISDYLVRTQGYPYGWNTSNVELIGLSTDEENILSKQKIENLLLMNYDTAKEKFGLSIENFYLKIIDINNITLYSYGNFNYENATSVLQITRICLIDNETNYILSNLIFGAWFNE